MILSNRFIYSIWGSLVLFSLRSEVQRSQAFFQEKVVRGIEGQVVLRKLEFERM